MGIKSDIGIELNIGVEFDIGILLAVNDGEEMPQKLFPHIVEIEKAIGSNPVSDQDTMEDSNLPCSSLILVFSGISLNVFNICSLPSVV